MKYKIGMRSYREIEFTLIELTLLRNYIKDLEKEYDVKIKSMYDHESNTLFIISGDDLDEILIVRKKIKEIIDSMKESFYNFSFEICYVE